MPHTRPISRRRFLRRSAETAVAVGAVSTMSLVPPDRLEILVNHVGFTPGADKRCLIADARSATLKLLTVATGKVVQSIAMIPTTGDFGPFAVGDFSSLTQPGEYELRGQGLVPARFEISDRPYSDAISKSVRYFARQRCGDSRTGHHAPCHLDDGFRLDSGKHQDTTGGWHDACDLRRWVDATIYGMVGLCDVHDHADAIGVNRADIIDELRWGESYFRKMQEPAGYLMNYCGGDDGNHYTDNVIGSDDDRPIHVEPADLIAQYAFVAAELKLARLTRDSARVFSDGCLTAGMKCLNWCEQKATPETASHLSAAVLAMCEVQRTTGDANAAKLAVKYLDRLLELQVRMPGSDLSCGAFLRSRGQKEFSREIHHGNLPPLALCDAIETFDVAQRAQWRDALQLACHFHAEMARRSAFSIVPFGLYLIAASSNVRRLSPSLGYRYFMRVNDEYSWSKNWWVGINAHLASTGCALAHAGRILKEPAFTALAQRQLDWILGSNPFAASTVTGVGRNQPTLYVTTEFKPPTPSIDGGVMNGIGGSADDTPTISSGSWNTCEYWTPMVAYTMKLMAALQS